MKKLLEKTFPGYADMWRILAGKQPKGNRWEVTEEFKEKTTNGMLLTIKAIDNHLEKRKTQAEIFDDIIGYSDIKKIINSMLNNRPISVLLDGPAGAGKSMFLHDITKFYPESSVYVNGTKVTKAGLFRILFEDEENKISILCINEIDKMGEDTQEVLLDLLEEGILSETQNNNVRSKRYDNISVFATSNDLNNLTEPLRTRFFKIQVKAYTEVQFKEIAASILPQYKLSPEVIEHIITSVWTKKTKPNIRDVKQIAKLCNNSKEMIDLLMENSG